MRGLCYHRQRRLWAVAIEKGLIVNLSIGKRWESFVDQAVKNGRYGSASEVVREGLRLVEEREAKLTALRNTLDASITAGGETTDEKIDAAIVARAEELRRKGVGA
jgi:antitoxin ParD1/3/4